MAILVCVTRKKSAAAAITMICCYEAHWQSTEGRSFSWQLYTIRRKRKENGNENTDKKISYIPRYSRA